MYIYKREQNSRSTFIEAACKGKDIIAFLQLIQRLQEGGYSTWMDTIQPDLYRLKAVKASR
jgi:hypothetical protein